MSAALSRFVTNDDGATAIEYGLIAALMAVGCIAAFIAFGNNLNGLFGYVGTRGGGAMDAATGG